MFISVHVIDEAGISLEFKEKPETFPVLAEMTESEDCKFLAPIRTRVRVVRIRHMIEVEGTVETEIHLACSCCLKPFQTPLTDRFSLAFTQEVSADEEQTDPLEKKLSAEEMGLIHFQGEKIDLRETIQEQIMMALPQRPLCSRSCKGLCPQCGVDLNVTDCGCERPIFNGKLAALKDFKVT